MSKRFAIIVAGGSGKRMGMALPKQFVPIGGLPMLVHSLVAFHKADPQIELILVLPSEHMGKWRKLRHEISLDFNYHVVEGGAERFHSVTNALNKIDCHEGWVAVHDAARPLITPSMINRLFQEAENCGSAVPSLPVRDSIRIFDGHMWQVTDRSLYRIIQTPQVFPVELLVKAYQQDFLPAFTDDASVYESAGNRINITEGEDLNFKVTTAADLELVQYLIENKKVSGN